MSQAPVGEVLVGEGLEGLHDPPQASHGINAPGEAPGRPSSSASPASWRRLKRRWRQSQDPWQVLDAGQPRPAA